MVMLEWFGRMLGLPKTFLPFSTEATGGGVIQSSASDCVLVALLAARANCLKEMKQKYP